MYVRQVMSKNIISATDDTPLPKIWQLIFTKHIHGLPIVDKNKKLLGIISEEDILSKLFPDYQDIDSPPIDDDQVIQEKVVKLQALTAKKIMNPRVVFTRVDSHIMRALARMIVRKVRQLPVLDENNKLIGMISKGDIFDWLFKTKPKLSR